MFQRDLRGITKKTSLFNTAPLESLIDTWLSDFDCDTLINSSAKKIYLLTTCLQTKNLTVFTTDSTLNSSRYDIILIQSAQEFKEAMLASANQPILMPPIQVNKNRSSPDKAFQYVDGGVVEYVGTEIAMDAGAQSIFSILLSSGLSDSAPKTFTKILDIAQITVDSLSADVGANDERVPSLINDGLSYLDSIQKSLIHQGVNKSIIQQAFDSYSSQNFNRIQPYNLNTIRPSKKLFSGLDALIFDPDNMKKMLELGRQDAKAYIMGKGVEPTVFLA